MRSLAVKVRVLLVLLAVPLGAVAGTVALLGTATITVRPPLFLLAGLAAFCAAYLTGLLLATRGVLWRGVPVLRTRGCRV